MGVPEENFGTWELYFLIYRMDTYNAYIFTKSLETEIIQMFKQALLWTLEIYNHNIMQFHYKTSY